MRLPSDMLFFPSMIPGGGSAEAYQVEGAMAAFLKAPEDVFNAVFATAYAKMLEIGTGTDTLTPLIESNDEGDIKSIRFVTVIVSSAMALLLLVIAIIYIYFQTSPKPTTEAV